MIHRAKQLALLLLAVLCLIAPAAAARTAAVSVRNDYFAPRTVTIARGDTVRWVWRSRGRKHNVASPSFGDSGNKRRGAYAMKFARAGRYAYFCFLHDGMSGTVVVRR